MNDRVLKGRLDTSSFDVKKENLKSEKYLSY